MAEDAGTHAYELLEAGSDVVVARIVKTEGSVPRHAGAMMVFAPDGRRWGTVGGGTVEARTIEEAAGTFRTKERQHVVHYDLRLAGKHALGMVCGGGMDIQIDYYDQSNKDTMCVPVAKPTTAFVFGAGHVGQVLEPVLRSVNFQTVMVDDRAVFADAALFPQSLDVVAVDCYANAFDRIQVGEESYVIITTSTFDTDLDVLRNALTRPCAYIGLMGSQKKIAYIFNRLREEGVSEQRLQKVYAPIGENIHAETPQEIAISVVAELIRVRSGHGTR